MATINGENAKNIRQPMKVEVTVWKRYNKPNQTNIAYYEFTNENLISCELSLRADLQPIDPSLPESEINIEGYWPEDVSEEVLTIADDTIITYQAGYDGDMSPVRVFYLAEKIDWADQIMTIRGIDAVHFLDSSCPPFFIGSHYCGTTGSGTSASPYKFTKQAYRNSIKPLNMLYYAFCDVIKQGGVTLVSAPPAPKSETSVSASNCNGVIERQSRRDLIANIMNLCRFEDASWYTYVDAGRPTVKRSKPSSSWTIYETDCGEIKRNVDKNIVRIDAKCKDLSISPCIPTSGGQSKPGGFPVNVKVGSGTSFEHKGFALNFNVLTSMVYFVKTRDDVPDASFTYLQKYWAYFLGYPTRYAFDINQKLKYQYDSSDSEHEYGKILLDTEAANWQSYGTTRAADGTIDNSVAGRGNSQLFGEQLSYDKWYGDGDGDTDIELYGGAYNLTETTNTYSITGSGIIAKPSNTYWAGEINAYTSIDGTSTIKKVLPDEGMKALMTRSNETGSFTWKGDPRMQPRDVFTFVYKDGTTELRTIESIDLKHEGGGTVAEIVYRKGII